MNGDEMTPAEIGSLGGPHRRLRLTLDLHADSLRDLMDALELIADDLAIGGSEECNVVSGGRSAGYALTLVCDPEQTGDRHREQIKTWREADRG